MALLMLVAGLVILTAGAELLIRGATKLAVVCGISPLVVGLTVVAFGTSAPELVVSVQSAYLGKPDVALGNVVGSNIFNILFILGISALIVPLRVSQQLIRLDVPLLVLVSLIMGAMAYDGLIGKLDGLLLASGLVAYTAFAVVKSRKEEAGIRAEYEAEFGPVEKSSGLSSILKNLALIAVGLAMLILGSRWFVEAAVDIARSLGISELVIGLTIVAVGTSLPEVATSIMAAIRGERDIAVGNVVGSNLFNIMSVLGIASLASPQGIAVSRDALQLDIPIMIAVTVACLPIFFTGNTIARWEGGLFFGYYIAYTVFLILNAAAPGAAGWFALIMLVFVIPLTVITLLVTVFRAWGQPPATYD
ncbi:MAG: calcium/sodium antiporter [Pirellulaceae bacterium]|nr:calcium/sodium antiporter [Pirellulaceae bacterium]